MKKKKKERLKKLCPFLDEKDTIRVGGRVKQARIPYEWKHQIILPAKHHITTLILREYHNRGLDVDFGISCQTLEEHIEF